jgi:hypothetical protein
LELANVCEKEKIGREEQEREEKIRVLTIFRWVFLEFFSSRSKISGKYLLCETQFWFKFTLFQLSTSIPAAKNRGFFRDFRKCDFKSQSLNAP